MKKVLFFLIFLLYLPSSGFTQNQRLDSLWAIFSNTAEQDTNRLYAIHAYAWTFNSNNPDSSILMAEKELALAKQSGERKFEGRAYNTIGFAYNNKGAYPKALEYLLKALSIAEELNDPRGKSNSCINIAIVYQQQQNYEKAIEYNLKCLEIMKIRGNKKGEADCYNNIGNVYSLQINFPKALEYYKRSLAIQEEIGNIPGIGTTYINIGVVYDNSGDHTKALEYYLKALEISKALGFMEGVGTCYLNISETYSQLDQSVEALRYADSSFQVSIQTGDLDLRRRVYQGMAMGYEAGGNYKRAYETHKLFKRLTDSLFNEENSRQLGDLKTKFEVEKKESELKIKAAAQDVINAEEKQKQQIIIYAVIGILLLVLIFSFFLYNRFRLTQKQKKIIEEQKVLVDEAYEKLNERNTEVIDSINYASRIQRTLIPSEKYIDAQLKRLMKKK